MTKTAAVRKMLEIRVRIALVAAVGVDTMTIPLVELPLTMGFRTKYRWSGYRVRMVPVA